MRQFNEESANKFIVVILLGEFGNVLGHSGELIVLKQDFILFHLY